LNLLDNRQVLLVDKDERETRVVRVPRSRLGGVELEAEVEIHGLGVLHVEFAGVDVERLEDLEISVDGLEVAARSWHHEALECAEGEFARAGCQEWERAGCLVEELAVESILFAFLTNDRADSTDQPDVSVRAEGVLHILKRAQDEIGEGRCETDGLFKTGDWEVVFAWEDGRFAKVDESVVGIESM